MRRLLISLQFVLVFSQSFSQNLEKVMMKDATRLHNQECVYEEILLSDLDLSEILPTDRFFILKTSDSLNLLGYCYSSSAMGRYEYFDYFILYNLNLEVELVKVWLYRSSNGGAVAGKRWLEQFKGYKGEDLVYGKDIQAISGATLSGTSIVSDIQRVHEAMLLLRAKEII